MGEMTEEQIHMAVVQYLNVVLPDGSVVHHSPNQMKAKIGWHAKLKKLGMLKGFPDLMIMAPSEAYIFPEMAAPIFFEIKSATGRLSEAQRGTLNALQGCDAYTAVVRSVEDAEEHLKTILSLRGGRA